MQLLTVFFAMIFLGVPAQGLDGELHHRKQRYAGATYHYSHEPTKAVLTISTRGQNLTTRSVIVFGDGRLEISHDRIGEWEGQISREEMDRLMDMAVRHGLAEWDGDTIRAWQLADFGRPFLGEADGMTTRILLNLEWYERDGYQVEELRRVATVRSPAFVAERFPDIPQFTAIENLVSWLAGRIEEETQQ
jgi:hypothetical protein